MGAVVAALQGTPLDTGLSLRSVAKLADYWELARPLYAPFEATVTMKSGSADVYEHEIPGGQYTNLHFQAHSLGLAHKFPEIKKAYAAANRLLGDISKVTPSSKVVGDLAQFMVQNHLDEQAVLEQAEHLSFPSSVVEYFEGYLGQPYGGFPEPLRTKVLKSRHDSVRLEGRPGESLTPIDFESLTRSLCDRYSVKHLSETDVLSHIMYPKVFDEYMKERGQWGPLERLPTHAFFQGLSQGESVTVKMDNNRYFDIKLNAVGELNAADGKREVFMEVNGQPRSVFITDEKNKGKAKLNEQASGLEGSVGAPMPGTIVDVRVKVGQTVQKNDGLAVPRGCLVRWCLLARLWRHPPFRN
eukprot:EG_transcript_4485